MTVKIKADVMLIALSVLVVCFCFSFVKVAVRGATTGIGNIRNVLLDQASILLSTVAHQTETGFPLSYHCRSTPSSPLACCLGTSNPPATGRITTANKHPLQGFFLQDPGRVSIGAMLHPNQRRMWSSWNAHFWLICVSQISVFPRYPQYLYLFQ